MASSVEALSPVASKVAQMTGIQKLAVLLVILGPDSVVGIMKHLDEPELEAVSSEMTKVRLVQHELQQEILKEFTEVAVQASTAILGGVQYTQSVLEKSVGAYRASNIISRVSPTQTPGAAAQQIAEMEPRQISNLLKHEKAQTIALVISYLAPEKSSQVLSLLRPDLREQVVERLASLAPTPVEVVEKLVQLLNQKLGTTQTRALNQTGGVKAAANLLNAMEKNLSKSVLAALEERSPELGQAIRQKMFTFEDLAELDASSLQKLLREVEMRDLAVALKTASDKLKTALLSCVSRHAAETITEEMSFLGPLKLRDIEACQLRIIDVVRRLESEGEIDLSDAKVHTRDEVLA
ncbi:MAG: flagellar motor switch protein FliG [Verrucomicrobiota bacterium]